MAFGFFRDKASHSHNNGGPGVQNHYYPPPTPQGMFSGGQQQLGGADGGAFYGWQGQQAIGYGGEPAPSGFARLENGREGEASPSKSPSKRVGWN
jgi:hypothetical protein